MNIPNNISEIARIIAADWKKMYFGARPYVEAMYALNSITDSYGDDSGRSVVCHFLGNAQTWKGETAKAVKAKLNELLKTSRA